MRTSRLYGRRERPIRASVYPPWRTTRATRGLLSMPGRVHTNPVAHICLLLGKCGAFATHSALTTPGAPFQLVPSSTGVVGRVAHPARFDFSIIFRRVPHPGLLCRGGGFGGRSPITPLNAGKHSTHTRAGNLCESAIVLSQYDARHKRQPPRCKDPPGWPA